MIKEIRKIGVIIAGIGLVMILVLSFNISYMLAFILGVLASNVNFVININSLDLDQTRNVIAKSMSSFLIRMIIYTIVMCLGFFLQGTVGLILAFVGCLTIRVAILVYSIKGGIVDGHFK